MLGVQWILGRVSADKRGHGVPLRELFFELFMVQNQPLGIHNIPKHD
jgi:hypothetical protein